MLHGGSLLRLVHRPHEYITMMASASTAATTPHAPTGQGMGDWLRLQVRPVRLRLTYDMLALRSGRWR